jgi:hypothetical protein
MKTTTGGKAIASALTAPSPSLPMPRKPKPRDKSPLGPNDTIEPTAAEIANAGDVWRWGDYELMAQELRDARTWYTKYRDLVTASEMPEPFRSVLEAGGDDANEASGITEEPFEPDYEKKLHVLAIAAAQSWRKRRMLAVVL